MKRVFCGAALGRRGDGRAGVGAATDRRHGEAGCAHRHVEPLLRHQRPRRGDRRADGDRGFRRLDRRQEDRDRPGRRPEQGRRRRHHRRPLVRHRAGRRHPGHRRLVLVDRHLARRQRQEEDLPRHRSGLVGHHRQALQRLHGALGLRHLRARQRHRLGGRQGRRRQLVLPHRRLRLRLRPAARRRQRRQQDRRQGRWARSAIPSTPTTSRRSCCRPRPRRRRSSVSPMPAATPSTRSSRPRSSASSRAARSSPACWSSCPTCTRSAWSAPRA